MDCGHTPATDPSPLKAIPLEGLDITHTSIQDLSPLQHPPLKLLRISIRLLDPGEELLRGLPVESLAMASWPAEAIPFEDFRKKFEARKQAAIDFANDNAKLPVTEQTAAVLTRLKELDTQGITLETTIEDGVVAQAIVGISRVQDDTQEDVRDEDLGPLRAFALLRQLHITGNAEFVDLSPLNVAPFEAIHCSRASAVLTACPVWRACHTGTSIGHSGERITLGFPGGAGMSVRLRLDTQVLCRRTVFRTSQSPAAHTPPPETGR